MGSYISAFFSLRVFLLTAFTYLFYYMDFFYFIISCIWLYYMGMGSDLGGCYRNIAISRFSTLRIVCALTVFLFFFFLLCHIFSYKHFSRQHIICCVHYIRVQVECNQIFADKVGPTMIKYDKCKAKRNSLGSAGAQ